MSKADAATRVYHFGVTLSDIAERKREDATKAHLATNVEALYTDLQTRLEISFDFTKPQNVRLFPIQFFVGSDAELFVFFCRKTCTFVQKILCSTPTELAV